MTASTSTTVRPGIDSYAPQIVIKVDGQEVALDDVIDLRVTLQKDELGGFSLQLSNHFDIKSQKFRHSDDPHLDMFKPVEIFMGYAAPKRLHKMFVGEILTMAPAFPSSGLTTLNLTGTDLLGRLRRAKPGADQTKSFPNKADWEIAQAIAKRHDLALSKDSAKDGKPNPNNTQRDMDDLKFLLWLAKRNDYEAAIIIEDNKEALYFGRPRDKRSSETVTQTNLTWGETLVSFTPRMSVGRQVSKVTVRGWDARKKEPIVATASIEELKPKGNGDSAASLIARSKSGAKDERIVDRVVQSQREAKDLALQLLAETANQFLTGTGEAMGEPAIRPQTIVNLAGLGCRFNGEYYVAKADHVYGASGYMTTFEVERMKAGTCP